MLTKVTESVETLSDANNVERRKETDHSESALVPSFCRNFENEGDTFVNEQSAYRPETSLLESPRVEDAEPASPHFRTRRYSSDT